MSVTARINGLVFTFDWSEFEKLSTHHCIEILDIREGGAYVAA